MIITHEFCKRIIKRKLHPIRYKDMVSRKNEKNDEWIGTFEG